MKIAVVGGGIYGCTIASELGIAGHEVSLFEASHELLGAASFCNQGRLHRGYHYPRSPETIEQCKLDEASFLRVYGGAALTPAWPLYAIMAQGSRTSPDAYISVLKEHNLRHTVLGREVMDVGGRLDPKNLSLVVRAWEKRIDLAALRELAWKRVAEAKVSIRLGERAQAKVLKPFDRVIVAAYAGMNSALAELGIEPQRYQFEVVEKPLVNMPDQFDRYMLGYGVVVLDGEAGCSLDEYAAGQLYAAGHVEHAILSRSVGVAPEIPDAVRPVLDKGYINDPPSTRWPAIRDAGSAFIPELNRAIHRGSMFTVRAVLPNVEATDERPTVVTWHSERVASVFSGKIGGCVQAAEDITRRIDADGRDIPVVRQGQEAELHLHRPACPHSQEHGRAAPLAAA